MFNLNVKLAVKLFFLYNFGERKNYKFLSSKCQKKKPHRYGIPVCVCAQYLGTSVSIAINKNMYGSILNVSYTVNISPDAFIRTVELMLWQEWKWCYDIKKTSVGGKEKSNKVAQVLRAWRLCYQILKYRICIVYYMKQIIGISFLVLNATLNADFLESANRERNCICTNKFCNIRSIEENTGVWYMLHFCLVNLCIQTALVTD